MRINSHLQNPFADLATWREDIGVVPRGPIHFEFGIADCGLESAPINLSGSRNDDRDHFLIRFFVISSRNSYD